MVFTTVGVGAALGKSLCDPVELRFDLSTPPVVGSLRTKQDQNVFNPDMGLVFNFGARLSDSMTPPARSLEQ